MPNSDTVTRFGCLVMPGFLCKINRCFSIQYEFCKLMFVGSVSCGQPLQIATLGILQIMTMLLF